MDSKLLMLLEVILKCINSDEMAKLRYEFDPNAEIYQYLEFKIGATTEDSNETYLGLTQADFGD